MLWWPIKSAGQTKVQAVLIGGLYWADGTDALRRNTVEMVINYAGGFIGSHSKKTSSSPFFGVWLPSSFL